MIKNELLVKLAGFWFFPRWHPEIALRYLPIVDAIKSLEKNLTILEVGSGGLGIVPYLNREVTGVDIAFNLPIHPKLRQVKDSVTHLPFRDTSFDIVISVDMLEHLEKKERIKAVDEMLRVARKKIFVSVPCGKYAYKQDLYLDKYFREKYGSRYQFLEEQVTLGLPEEKDIYDKIVMKAKERKRPINLEVFGNENLNLRLFLMKGFISKNLLANLFFRKILLFALPILRLYSNEPTYRKLFVVTLT